MAVPTTQTMSHIARGLHLLDFTVHLSFLNSSEERYKL